MIRAVLFDLDGTLLDRDASVKAFIEEQYSRLSRWIGHVPKEVYTTKFVELDDHGYVWKDKVYHQLIQEFNIIDLTKEDLLDDYLNHFKNCCVPFPNLHSMLEEFKKKQYLLGMITNGKGKFQMDNIKALEIERYFNAILISEWEGIKKPDPKIFTRALQLLNVTAEECVFVGDHPLNDIKAPIEIGMKAILKKSIHLNDNKADAVVDDLATLPTIVENL
ncbi:HAD family hydrolase [Radiobacillus sp. PE A8.2]|uniref:HAD family hydrolase n=1 Tax=Radiobacillus sp. PE A8.2 TaxID=3380349 RepID=UPI00388D7185